MRVGGSWVATRLPTGMTIVRASAGAGCAARHGQANDGGNGPLRPSCARPFAARQLHLSRSFHPPRSARNPASGDPPKTTIADYQIVPLHPADFPELAATDQGVRASSKGWSRRLAKPQRQSRALTADVLAVIRLTAIQPRKRGRVIETPEQAEKRARFDVALVAILSDAGLRWSEASSLIWGDIQRWDDGSGRITIIRSKTDVEAQGAVVAITPTALRALDAIRPAGVAGGEKVFGCPSPESPGG